MPVRVLVAKDEALVALALADALARMGHHVLGPVAAAHQAVPLLDDADLVLPGRGLADGMADDLAYLLRARGTLFAWLTASAPGEFDPLGAHVLQKPWTAMDLGALVRGVEAALEAERRGAGPAWAPARRRGSGVLGQADRGR